jgi:hypothetical protein
VYANILFSIIYNLTSLKRIPEKSVQMTNGRGFAKIKSEVSGNIKDAAG